MNTKKMCLTALCIALVCIATMLIRVPIPATNGYINMGDGMLLTATALLGAGAGAISGGLGSALADLLSGYPHWAIATFIIKGLEGLLFGGLIKALPKLPNIIPAALALVFMVFGYFVAGAILEGSVAVSLTSVPPNIVQGAGGLGVYVLLHSALKKAKLKI